MNDTYARGDDGPAPQPPKDPDLYDRPPRELANHVMFGGGGKRVGLMTAEAPRFPSAPGGNDELERDLRGQGLKYEKTQGSHGGPENSFIIHHPTREQMDHLGKKYGQESVVFGEGGRHELRYTGGENEGCYHPSLPLIRYSQKQPADYYTKIPGAGHVALHFDFDKLMGNPVAKAEDIRSELLNKLYLVLRKNT